MSDLATLKLKVDVQRRLIAMLSLRRVRQSFDAAHLLAHQQARALELAAERSRYSTALETIISLECDSDDLADTCGCASCRAHEALASSDELSEIAIRDTELATLRAENERLRAELVVRAMDVSGDRTLCRRCRTTRWLTNDPSDPAWQARRENHPHERSCPLFRAAPGEDVRDEG